MYLVMVKPVQKRVLRLQAQGGMKNYSLVCGYIYMLHGCDLFSLDIEKSMVQSIKPWER